MGKIHTLNTVIQRVSIFVLYMACTFSVWATLFQGFKYLFFLDNSSKEVFLNQMPLTLLFLFCCVGASMIHISTIIEDGADE